MASNVTAPQIETKDFLVELGTEELPPTALRRLGEAFQANLLGALKEARLQFTDSKAFASPRRLAVQISSLETAQADIRVEKIGPAVDASYDDSGKPTKAAEGFARSCGVDVDQLQRKQVGKVEKLAYSANQAGRPATELLPDIIETALRELPIPKRMRWGSSRAEFVRPVQWLVLLLGEDVIPATILGLASDRLSYGHRVHGPGPLSLTRPADYPSALENAGVIADYDRRKEMIRDQLIVAGKTVGATAVIPEKLLEEVAALVECPVTLIGEFDSEFLEVPQEALILAMTSHQKYFYLLDKAGKLLPRFILVANLNSTDPSQIVSGNEKVIRPRLADARFFFETDKQTPLATRREKLKDIVFQDKLGTLYEKTERVAALAGNLAEQMSIDLTATVRCAQLAKCDLLTDMVGEFADLQGRMGYHYALADGEGEEVATAIQEHYQPRFAGDDIPGSDIGKAVAIADKLDTIVGLFAIGQPPTGSKDPFALRRAALGVLRIIVEGRLPIDLRQLLSTSFTQLTFLEKNHSSVDEVFAFMQDRFKAWYQDEGVSSEVVQSVLAVAPTKPFDFARRITAVSAFAKLPQAASLAAANKRVANLIAKSEVDPDSLQLEPGLLSEAAEIALHGELEQKVLDLAPSLESQDYDTVLNSLAELRETVDHFFDDVLVMAEDPAIRANRLALLVKLRALFLRVADISCLHTG
jgi:glycyl-tRNA synthetase beta chain